MNRPPSFAADATPRRARPGSAWRFVLFDPTVLFSVLGRILAPVRRVSVLLWPATALAILAVIHNWYALLADTELLYSSFEFVPHMLISLLTTNLFSKVMQGTVITYMGGTVDRFGVRLLLGLYPRFFIGLESVRRLPFRAQRICYAASLKTRLSIFSLGILAWAIMRPSGSGAADAALVIALVGLGAFLFGLNPLWPADGYRWMSAWFEQPKLREDGLRIVGRVFSRKPLPTALSRRRIWSLFAYALASVAYMALFFLLLASGIAVALEQQFSGTGVFLFSVILAVAVLFLVSKFSGHAERKASRGGGRYAAAGGGIADDGDAAGFVPAGAGQEVGDRMGGTGGLGSRAEVHQLGAAIAPAAVTARARRQARVREGGVVTPARQATDLEALLDPKRARRSLGSRWKRLLVFALLLAGALYVAFLPYPYQVGGEFVVQPFERAEVRARTDGEVVEVLADEGELVSEGQILARLSSWDEKRDIEVLEAEIARGMADLATLTAPPRPEEISVAEQKIATAEVRVESSRRELARQQELVSSGVGAVKFLEEAQSAYEAALSELEEARAELELLRAPALESEVAAAEAELLRDRRDLEYKRLQLAHTEIRAPISGRIVTPQAELAVGSFLPVGGLFVEIEDTGTALAEIEVPETDITEVEPGARSVLKLWSSPLESAYGTVRRISPKAEDREFGRIVRVLVAVPNPEERLRPNMTGYGKIDAKERPVWEAFTRAFVRFFEIELWSWFP